MQPFRAGQEATSTAASASMAADDPRAPLEQVIELRVRNEEWVSDTPESPHPGADAPARAWCVLP
jgi:hypothetical protein